MRVPTNSPRIRIPLGLLILDIDENDLWAFARAARRASFGQFIAADVLASTQRGREQGFVSGRRIQNQHMQSGARRSGWHRYRLRQWALARPVSPSHLRIRMV